MISDEVNIGTISRTNFGVCLKPNNDFRFVPSDAGVQASLVQILSDSVDQIEGLGGEWEEYDVSEDYGAPRKVNWKRSDPLATRLSALYDLDAMADVGDIMQHIGDVEFYLAQFWDADDRKIIGVAKSPQFKAALSANRRMILWGNDTLKLVEGSILRLERTFDALITDGHIYMARPRAVEHIADIVFRVAETAKEKIEAIEAAIPFLDLSYIKRDIGKHPRMARLAASIAKREDLAAIQQDKLIDVCEQHAILLRPVDGKLKPARPNENALLEVLDDRRYSTQLTGADAVPFRASGRQRVQR